MAEIRSAMGEILRDLHAVESFPLCTSHQLWAKGPAMRVLRFTWKRCECVPNLALEIAVHSGSLALPVSSESPHLGCLKQGTDLAFPLRPFFVSGVTSFIQHFLVLTPHLGDYPTSAVNHPGDPKPPLCGLVDIERDIVGIFFENGLYHRFLVVWGMSYHYYSH